MGLRRRQEAGHGQEQTCTQSILIMLNGLSIDASGGLTGTIESGNLADCGNDEACQTLLRGKIYKLSPPSTAGGYWTYSLLYNYSGGSDGNSPAAGVVPDATGALYGTTVDGGAGYGTVFKLAPVSGGGWAYSVLYSFLGSANGSTPTSGLLPDASGSGAFYGMTSGGLSPSDLPGRANFLLFGTDAKLNGLATRAVRFLRGFANL
jgi:hypothetical protein